MEKIINGFETDKNAKLNELRKLEEMARKALEGASRPISEGGATEAVTEVLQGAYYAAKQERESYEAEINI